LSCISPYSICDKNTGLIKMGSINGNNSGLGGATPNFQSIIDAQNQARNNANIGLQAVRDFMNAAISDQTNGIIDSSRSAINRTNTASLNFASLDPLTPTPASPEPTTPATISIS
jgi:hypothetical protein